MYDLLKSLEYEIIYNSKFIGTVKWGEMREAILKFFTQNVKSQDTLLFYFSGHGIPDDYGDNFLATSEIDPFIPYDKGFSFDEFTKMMQRSISTKIIAILDCCYSGAAKVSKGDDEDAVKLGRAAMRNKLQALEGEGRCILAASQGLQKAYLLKEHNHSLFTYYLLDGLRGANGESVDNDGNVTPDSLGKYVYDKVTEFSPNQKPIKKVEASGDIILAHYPHFARSIDKQLSIQNITSIINKGKEYIDKGEFQNAVHYLEEVIKQYPNNAEVWNSKGQALLELDKHDEAIRCFDISISLDQHNEKPWINKGLTLHNLRRHDEAISRSSEI